jgi:predicted secreted Zn-dependent protease
MRMFRALATSCLSWMPLAAAAGPSVEYYTIQGSTARELRAEMNRLGPTSEAGVRNDGYTHWDIQWRYDYDRTAGGCTAGNFRVTLEVRITMPRWNPPAGAPRELIARWQRFEQALRVHEDGHYDLAVAAADEVRRVLQANRDGLECRRLEEGLNAAGAAVLAELKLRQARYDRDTDSGRKQGVGIL